MTDGLKVAFAVILGFLLLVGGWYAVGLSGVASESTYPPPATPDYAHEFTVEARHFHKPIYWLGPDLDREEVFSQGGAFFAEVQDVPISDSPYHLKSVGITVTTLYGTPPSWLLTHRVIKRRSVGNGELVVASAPGNVPITPDLKRTVHAKLQVYKPA